MQHGKPSVVDGTNVQPVTREGEAGRWRVAERPVVPGKPGNAGGGKGPWFKASVRRSEEREIGQPSNSAECSEATDGAPCQSEGRAELSVPCALRQAVPRGCAAFCLPVLPREPRRPGGGRSAFRGHRSEGCGTLARRVGEDAQREDVPGGSDSPGVYPKAQRQVAATGDSDDPRPGSADGDGVSARSDLRSRPATTAIRLPAGSERTRCDRAGSQPAQNGSHAGR